MKRLSVLLIPIFILTDSAVARAASGSSGTGDFLIWYVVARIGIIGVIVLFMFGFKKKNR